MQRSRISEKPMSLPPMVTVTACVSARSESNCGGLGPGDTFWGWVMSSVSAPEQLASVSAYPVCRAARFA